MARSFRFVTAFAGNIVFNYLTVSVNQAKGYSPFTDPPMPALSVKTAGDYHSSKLEEESGLLCPVVGFRNGKD